MQNSKKNWLKTTKQSPLSKNHKEKQKQEKYIKTDFSTVMLNDKCRATVNGLE